MQTPGPVETDPVSGLSLRLLQPAPVAPRRLLVLLHGVGGNEQSVAGLAAGVPEDTLVALVRGRWPWGLSSSPGSRWPSRHTVRASCLNRPSRAAWR
jgi:predicted esterase